jgi:class 3 adenylate cyclase
LPLEVLADGRRVQRVVAITDLSGYTALSATDESRALLLGALLKRLGDRAAQRNGGKLIKSMGDAVMLTFASAGSALAAVRELHGEFDPAASAVGIEPLPLHSALHVGEIGESHDGDIYGQTVNVTARLVDAAGKHEIVMSGAVMEALPAPPTASDIGERRFKNVPQAVRCYRLDAAQSPAPAPSAPDSPPATPAPTH